MNILSVLQIRWRTRFRSLMRIFCVRRQHCETVKRHSYGIRRTRASFETVPLYRFRYDCMEKGASELFEMTLFPLEERSLARSRGLDVVLPDKKVAIVAERLGNGRDSGNSSAEERGGRGEGEGGSKSRGWRTGLYLC